MLRTEEWFGAGHLIDILLGLNTEKIRARGHDALPTYGVGKEYGGRRWEKDRPAVRRNILQLVDERYGAK